MVDEARPKIQNHPDLDAVHVPALPALDLRAFRAREKGELQTVDRKHQGNPLLYGMI